MSQLGRISGPLLKANLLRQGVDLAFETDLLYLDVNNLRIGVKTANPTHDLQVNGTTRTTNLELENRLDVGNITIENNTITSSTGDINIVTNTESAFVAPKFLVGDFTIFDNVIQTNSSNANIELRPNGTGQVEIYSDALVNGNLHVTGNITADGNIELGDADTDNVVFNADIASDIIPNLNEEYTLGSNPALGGKRWADTWVRDLYADAIYTANVIIDGINLSFRADNIIYVSENGDDTYTGTHPADPVRTVKQALSQAVSGDTIHIYPGEYQEIFPLTVPVGVTVRGTGIRSVKITPTAGTVDKDAFLLNGETTVEDLTVADFRFNSVNNTGYAFRFATNFTVTTRSPYVRNISVLTKGSVTSLSDPLGFDAGDAGKGAYVDGADATAGSNEASMLFHSVTFITPGVNALTATNGARIEWLNSFTYYANKGMYLFSSNAGFAGNGKTRIKLSSRTGTWNVGDTLSYYDTDGTTVLATGTIDSVDGDFFNIDGKVIGFETLGDRAGKTASIAGNAKLSTAQKKFGTASLSLDGTGDYISYVSQPDFGFGTSNFTIEAWVYKNTASQMVLFDTRTSGSSQFSVYVESNAAGNLRLFVNGSYVLTSSNSVSTGAWVHVALCKAGGTTRFFINGVVSTNTYADSNDYGTAKPIVIGASWSGSTAWNGYIDEVRISKGVARYTGTFTAPTNAFTNDTSTVLLLHFNGTNNSTIILDDGNTTQDIRNTTTGGTAALIDFADYSDFGAEVRSIGSACVYGNYGAYGDGDGVIAYLIGQNLAYIGLGKDTDNDPTSVIQANEIVQLNRAKLYYSSVDARGNFRVGEYFSVNQDTGEVIFSNSNLAVTGSIVLTDGVNTTTVQATGIETGNLRISGNTIESTINEINITAFNNEINLQSDTFITGNLDVIGNVTIGGNITIGDQTTDTVTISARVDSDIVPKITDTYNLGSDSLRWKELFTTKVTLDNIVIDDNRISTTVSNSDLEFAASGTGRVYVPEDNVLLDQNLTVLGTTNLNGTTINGNVTQTGNLTQTGNTTQTGDYTLNGLLTVDSLLLEGIAVQDNNIRTTNSNSDLQLQASGTGNIVVPTNDVVISQDLTVLGATVLNQLQLTGSITAPEFGTGDIVVSGNLIKTTLSNSDLELSANGTGVVNIPANDLQVTNDFTVLGSTTLNDTQIDGTLTHTGTLNQTGDTNQTGDYTLTGSIDISEVAQFKDVRINDNTVSTTLGTDLVLDASGSGKISIPNNNVQIDQNLTVLGDLTAYNINTIGTMTAPVLSNGDIELAGNLIRTTISNSDLELRANGTGQVLVPTNNVQINNDLIVNGTTYLNNSTVTGTITQVGNFNQTGTFTQTGNFTLNGNLSVTGETQFYDINIDNNVITTTIGNNDLILEAAGTGRVYIPSDNVVVEQNLTVTGNITASTLTVNQTLNTDAFSDGDIVIEGNLIQTTLSNSNLELRANGAGSVLIPSNNVTLGQNLTVTNATTLATTNLVGTLTQTGNTTQTGTVNQTGAYNLTGILTVNGAAQFKDIRVDNNVITTTIGNNDLLIQAAGSGKVFIPNNDVLITQNLSVTGNTTTANLTASGEIAAPTLRTSAIRINGNLIETTVSNANLELRANGTGAIEIEQVFVNQSTISTQNNDDLVLQPNGTGIVTINSTQSLKLPVGTELQRPIGQAGMVRFNTDIGGYEGFDGTNWRRLDGVWDVDRNTYITAELTPGSNDNIIRFYNNGALTASLTASRLDVPEVQVDDINISGTTISTTAPDADIVFAPNGTGSTIIGNFAFRQNTITNTVADSVTFFNQTGLGYFKISGTTGFVIPSGEDSQRGAFVDTGMIRFNTTDNRVEIYDGTQWISAAGAGGGVTITEAEDIAIRNALIFG
jgi:hypothetical protein